MILADTGFWLAWANRRDHFHQRAVAALAELSEPLVTTWPVLTEACHLLLHRLGSQAQQQFLESADAEASASHQFSSRVAPNGQLMQKYQDLPMDLADASLVLLAEHLGHGRILSTDQRDFETYRWKQHHPFENLL